jgi:chaperone BCS1
MMFWLSSLPQFRQFRDFSVSTTNFSLDDDSLELDDDDGMDENMRRRTRSVRYLPSYASSYRMWYKGRYITISRTKEENRWFSHKSTLEITSVPSIILNCIMTLKHLPHKNLFP